MAKKIRYKTIIKGNYCSIVSRTVNNNFTELDIFINKLDSHHSNLLDGLYLIMAEHANNGSRLLQSSNCHCAYKNKDVNIYEYRKGRLRVYWFYDKQQRNIVVCSHGIIKDTQTTAKLDKEKFIKAYKYYHDNRDSIIILEED